MDVCKALGYKENVSRTLKLHVDEEDLTKCKTLTSGGMQMVNFVNESGLYSLILGSKLPNAKAFKRWVTSEVLPPPTGQPTFSHPTIRVGGLGMVGRTVKAHGIRRSE